MEKDKSGENAAAFDCCFHPDAIRLSKSNIKFQDLLVQTAMEGVEAMYKSQRQNVSA